MTTEGMPEIVTIGDIDSDGIRDILLLTSDESTVIPTVVMVRRDGLVLPAIPPGFNWSAFQYTFADNVSTVTCLPFLRPKIVAQNNVVAISVAYGSSLTSDCRNPPRTLFTVTGGELKPILKHPGS